jgi:hypothetical protein
MSDTGPPDKTLDRISLLLRHHALSRISDRELANAVIADIADDERTGLVEVVIPMLPEPALRELEHLVDKILAPAASWVPISIGRISDEYRQRIVPACKQVAVEFRQLRHK